MTEKFIIEGGYPLQGTVIPSGNKNSALPLLVACLLTDEAVTLHNIPQIGDVLSIRKLLEGLGVKFTDVDEHTWILEANDIHQTNIDSNICANIRASILLAGPMVAKYGGIVLPPPGGDVIGRRRLDTHILAFQTLGVNIWYDDKERMLCFKSDHLQGADILLDEASVTATENIIMATVLASGTSIIRNAASEPHVQELCLMLNKMGAKIENIGSNLLLIQGVDKLHGCEFSIGPDYMEVVSLIGASIVTHSTIRIQNAGRHYLPMVQLIFNRLGVDWEYDDDDLIVSADQELFVKPDVGNAVPQISVMPWPAFPTDLMSIAIVVATQSSGNVLFHDWMYPSRMFFTDKLVAMGAQIVLCDPHRCIVHGPTQLYGSNLESPDIRAGMALVLAALAAKGHSVIRNIGQIDRGYENIDQKLATLGAKISRVQD
ncbi:MAG: UDP-N-acetylglucosamine 1-carboxyvinyltransferase [Chloroflexota bacterium]